MLDIQLAYYLHNIVGSNGAAVHLGSGYHNIMASDDLTISLGS